MRNILDHLCQSMKTIYLLVLPSLLQLDSKLGQTIVCRRSQAVTICATFSFFANSLLVLLFFSSSAFCLSAGPGWRGTRTDFVFEGRRSAFFMGWVGGWWDERRGLWKYLVFCLWFFCFVCQMKIILFKQKMFQKTINNYLTDWSKNDVKLKY